MEVTFSLREQYLLLRKQKGIRLREISKEIKVTIAGLSLYENGKMNLKEEKERLYRNIILHPSKYLEGWKYEI